MKNVFISYRRAQPDESLAKFLVQELEKNGQNVFWDNRITIGQDWASVIDKRIREANFFVVLLSAESMRSDMVREEIKLAYDFSRRPVNPLRILPLRVAYLGDLPYDLGAYLNPIQYAVWRDGSDSPAVAQQILNAVRSAYELPEPGDALSSSKSVTQLFEATEQKGAPLPKAELIFETGAVKLNSPFYVVRIEDSRVLRSVLGEGTTTVIKGTRQVGKSSLLARAIALAKQATLKTFYLDFQAFENAQLKDLSCLFKSLASLIAKEFRITWDPESFSGLGGGKVAMSDFLKQVIFSQVEGRVIFFFDEVDRVFQYAEYRDDFFGTIRFWHNERAYNPEPWNRLNLVIAHSTEPSLWIQDIYQSPFNVGERVRLKDFKPEHIADLNRRYGSVLKGEAELNELFQLVGGNPYLVRQAFYSMATNQSSLRELVTEATENDGPFGDHLKRCIWGVTKDPVLKVALKSVLRRGLCEEEAAFQRLAAVGLIEGADRSSARLRCALYEKYFRAHL